jgi:hypothetical protein
MARMGSEALYARPYSCLSARVRSWNSVEGVRRSEELIEALLIVATWIRS